MSKRTIGLLFLIILLTPVWMYLFWFFTPSKELKVLILDKTVLDTKTQEHVSLSWVLDHEKFTLNNESYESKHDYFGFFPNDSGLYEIKDFNSFPKSSLDSLATTYDVAYYTDLYGIYEGEWFEKYPNVSTYTSAEIDNSLEHTRKIYGGMTENEFAVLQQMKNDNKRIITEFNVIASPTSYSVRRMFENEFDINWSGWVGRYFESLDTLKNKELPRWLKRNYLIQHDNKWPYTKSGIVFVKNDLQIEILEKGTHLNIETPIIFTTEEYMKKYKLPSKMKYPFWFDIISTGPKNAVVSTYKILPNQRGRLLMKKYGIPEVFPAVIEHDSTDYRFHYFSGDFSDNPIGLGSVDYKWIEFFSVFSYRNNPLERTSFFWDFYRPMIKRILHNEYDLKKEKH